MKNFIKLFGIVALSAVIEFSFVSCNHGGGGGGEQLPEAYRNTTWYRNDGERGLQFNVTDFLLFIQPNTSHETGTFWVTDVTDKGEYYSVTGSATDNSGWTFLFDLRKDPPAVKVTDSGLFSNDTDWDRWVKQGTTPGNGGGGGDELWQKLTAGSGKWISNTNTLVFSGTPKGLYDGAYELPVTITGGSFEYYTVDTVYVKQNGKSGGWGGNLPAASNISLRGASSDTALIEVSADGTQMTISNGRGFAEELNGTYTKSP